MTQAETNAQATNETNTPPFNEEQANAAFEEAARKTREAEEKSAAEEAARIRKNLLIAAGSFAAGAATAVGIGYAIWKFFGSSGGGSATIGHDPAPSTDIPSV
jgi:F0F1-type ATP synthase assembly protein I